MSKSISVVIPAFNEEEYIAQTIESLKPFPEIKEIILIDDGSTDNTYLWGKKLGATMWRNKKNLGKGAAMNMGASMAQGEIVVFLDADLGYSAREANKLWQPIMLLEADCVIGKFSSKKKPGGLGLVKYLGNWGVKRFGGQEIGAVLSGQRAFSKPALEKVFPFHHGYGAEVGATIRLLKNGFRITEVEVGMEHRETGRNWTGFYHRGRQFQHILRALVQESLE